MAAGLVAARAGLASLAPVSIGLASCLNMVILIDSGEIYTRMRKKVYIYNRVRRD